MNEITKLERMVLQAILDSEFMDGHRDNPIGHSVWSYSVTGGGSESARALAGALGSCVKKGYAGAGEHEPGEPICWITAEGLAALRAPEQPSGDERAAARLLRGWTEHVATRLDRKPCEISITYDLAGDEDEYVWTVKVHYTYRSHRARRDSRSTADGVHVSLAEAVEEAVRAYQWSMDYHKSAGARLT